MRRYSHDESYAHMRTAWCNYARGTSSGEVLTTPHLIIAAANSPWPTFNAALPTAPLETEQALETALAEALGYFQSRHMPWSFVLSEEWTAPGLLDRVPALMEAHGLMGTPASTGMIAERLAEPVRPLPALEVRRVEDVRGRHIIGELNALCYGLSLEEGRQALDVPFLFKAPNAGYIGYVAGNPVTCTGVTVLEDVAYLGMVATLPEYRQRGYAEAIMRHTLAETRRQWGVERSSLHATPAGYPLYLQMGYQPLGRFHFFMGGLNLPH